MEKEERNNKERIVEIARFAYPAEAATLIALLRSEGIECYLRNELTTQIMAGYADVGGARVEILESGKEYTRDELRKLLSGHLCRCTGYENILNAVEKTMKKRLGSTDKIN